VRVEAQQQRGIALKREHDRAEERDPEPEILYR
jgi:hypothetical protein